MATITWRNVNDGGSNEALRSLMAASAGVTNSFGALQNVVQQAEAADKANFDRQKVDNTASFLDAIQSRYANPEALQAAIASGEVDQLRSGYGRAIDRNATRGAAEARLAAMRSNDLTGRQYANQVAQDTSTPLMQQASMLARQGKLDEANALVQQVDPRFQGTASQGVFDANRARVGFDQDQTKFLWAGNEEQRKGEAHRSNLASQAAARQASAASTALSNYKLSEAKTEAGGMKAFGQLANAYHAQVSEAKTEIEQLAKANPSIFGDKFNPGKMSQDQIAAADGLLQAKGMPFRMSVFTEGDTAAMGTAIQALREAGASPQTIAKAQQAGPMLFDSTGGAKIGTDAKSAERAKTLSAAANERLVEAAGGVPLTKEQFNNYITNELPKNIAHWDKGDKSAVLKAANKWAKKMESGVDMGDGVKVYPSAAMIANTVNSTDIPWWGLEKDVQKGLDRVTAEFKDKISTVKKQKDSQKVAPK